MSKETTNLAVFLLAGQSNMTGRGLAADLPASLRAVRSDIPYLYECWFGADGKAPASRSHGIAPLGPTPKRPTTAGPHFGPELSFADLIAKQPELPRIAILKYAYGGTNLYEHWNPDSSSGMQLFGNMIAFLRNAMQTLHDTGHQPHLKGVCWAQGEGDALREESASAYESNLIHFIEELRGQLDAPELPFVIAEAVPRRMLTAAAKPCAGYEKVPQAQRRIAEIVPNTSFVPTSDLRVLADGVHLDAPALVEFGERLAHSMLSHVQKAVRVRTHESGM